MTNLAEKYAPGLLDLAQQLVPFGCVIQSSTAGPQEFETEESVDEYLMIQVPDIYFPSNRIYVTISRTTCDVLDEDGGEYEVTFQGLLDYLGQLPKPLDYFAR